MAGLRLELGDGPRVRARVGARTRGLEVGVRTRVLN